MVYPPTLNDEPILNSANGILNQPEDVLKKYNADEIASIEDFDEAEPDSEIDIGEYAELPDLFEFDGIIDWDEIPDADDLTDREKQFYKNTKN